MIFVYKCIWFICLVWKCLIKFSLFIGLVFWKSSLGRSKNQFLFMFTGCVGCCTFLFIDVIVGWFVLLFVLFFRFCFQMFKCTKKGYYVLEFFIGVRNRDIMTKELSQICLFFVMSCLNIFSAWGS